MTYHAEMCMKDPASVKEKRTARSPSSYSSSGSSSSGGGEYCTEEKPTCRSYSDRTSTLKCYSTTRCAGRGSCKEDPAADYKGFSVECAAANPLGCDAPDWCKN